MKPITKIIIFFILLGATVYHLIETRHNEKVQESIYHAAMAIVFFVSLVGSQIGMMIE